MSIQFYPGIGDQCWNKDVIIGRLNNVAEADKTKQWIQQDLSTPQSGVFSKSFWVIAKHFDVMRRGIYGVDLDVSKNVLERLSGVVLNECPEVTDLFLRAVANFQRITGRSVDVPMQLFKQIIDAQNSSCECPPLKNVVVISPTKEPVPQPQPIPVVVEKPVVVPQPVVVQEPVVVQQPVIVQEPMVYREPVIVHEPVIVREPVFVPDPYPIFVRPAPIYVPPPRPIVTRRPVADPSFWSRRPVVPVTRDVPRMIPGTSTSTCPAPMAPPPRVIPGAGHRPFVPPMPVNVAPSRPTFTAPSRPTFTAPSRPTFTAPSRPTFTAPSVHSSGTRVAVGFGGTRRR